MASTFFFNGQQYVSPTVVSQVNDNAFAPVGATTGNRLAIVGISTGGAPDVLVTCDAPTDAIAAFVDGELVTAIRKAFAPSNETPSPNQVVAISVPKLVPAALEMVDSNGAGSIIVTASAFGPPGNNVKIKCEPSSDGNGLRLTVQNGTYYSAQDNLERPLFTAQYAGAQPSASAIMTATQLILQAPSNTTVASIDLASCATVNDLVQRVLSVPGWAAFVAPGATSYPVVGKVDSATFQNALSLPVTFKADLQAVVDWLNGPNEPYVKAVRAPNASLPPAPFTFTYLTNGSAPATVLSDWADAFTALQAADVQEIVVLSADPAVQALADAHCQYMSTVGRHERRCWTGMGLGAAIADVSAAAKIINSDRTAFVFPGSYDYDRFGVLTLYPGYMSAVHVAAGFAGLPPGQAMTNKSLTIRGVETVLRNPADTDVLIQSGITCIEDAQDGFRVVRSVSSWLNDNKFNRVESSCGLAVDYVERTLRDAVKKYRGQSASPQTLHAALEDVKTTLAVLSVPLPVGPGVLVGDAKSPPFLNPVGSIVGDSMTIEVQCSPVIPLNFIGIILDIVPYSGTASA